MTDLSPADLQRIFEIEIVPDLEDSSTLPRKQPDLLIVGGQPGSGKSTMIGRQAETYLDRGGLFMLSLDDYRQYHPDYENLMAARSTQMAAVTRPAAEVWQQMAADWLQHNRRNIAFEAGFRAPQKIMDLAKEFHTAGYHVEVMALAVPAAISKAGIVVRYATQLDQGRAGRWTTMKSHNSDYHGSIETLELANRSPYVSRITLESRTAQIHSEPPGAQPHPIDILKEARETPRDTKDILTRIDHALQIITTHNALTPEIDTMATQARDEARVPEPDVQPPRRGGASLG